MRYLILSTLKIHRILFVNNLTNLCYDGYMTTTQLNKLILSYRQFILDEPQQGDSWAKLSEEAKSKHISWMLQALEKHTYDWTELRGQPEVWTESRKMRWLGFIQGYLWATDKRTIDQMREDNRAPWVGRGGTDISL